MPAWVGMSANNCIMSILPSKRTAKFVCQQNVGRFGPFKLDRLLNCDIFNIFTKKYTNRCSAANAIAILFKRVYYITLITTIKWQRSLST